MVAPFNSAGIQRDLNNDVGLVEVLFEFREKGCCERYSDGITSLSVIATPSKTRGKQSLV